LKGLTLRDFQESAVDDLVAELHRAAAEVKDAPARGQAIWLSAPTGSGKTLMATAAIERILEGDARYEADTEAVFLWLSDQPELNEQTRKKMLAVSSVLGPAELLVIGTAFDEETLTSGRLYFLNIQKLGKGSNLVERGDARTYTIWQTISNTIARSPQRFFLFIDEAHRGTAERRGARDEVASIMQKFIKGSADDDMQPVPLIAGISATPERFQKLIAGTNRVQRPVDVAAADVRASGLLKEFITLYNPVKDEPGELTMLAQAAVAWRDFWDRWERYCAGAGEPVVRPILVVQVEDGTARQLSKTDLAECVRVIRAAVGADADRLLPPSAFAHAFQEEKPAPAGELAIRHIPASEIVDDPDVRVVFFKTSLNTGWDCPRAEAMMSFRTALDATAIAQLVGRMVRSPLARRIDADESLNSVALYLPHYDEANLAKVVERLTGADPDTALSVQVRRGEDVVLLSKAIGSERLFETLAALPSYVVPRPRRTSQVKRLMKLGRLLANDGIDENAIATASDGLLAILRAAYVERRDEPAFRDRVQAGATVVIAGRRVRFGSGEEEPLVGSEAERAVEDLDAQFEEAGRRVGEGLHKEWWRRRVAEDEASRVTAKLELVVLVSDSTLVATLEESARATTQAWLADWRVEIAALPEGSRQEYDEVRALASRSELTDREPYPEQIEGAKSERRWQKHLYVDADGTFPAKFNKWETKVIEAELARGDELLGWLRNPDRKPWSLTVPYRRGGQERPQYPDLLFIRRAANRDLVVDLLEPHMIDLADAAPKAVGLAEFASRHADKFGRIEFIVVDGDDIRRLNLADEGRREKVRVMAEGGDAEKLKQLLKDLGAN
jgi:type III restriction enzyme